LTYHTLPPSLFSFVMLNICILSFVNLNWNFELWNFELGNLELFWTSQMVKSAADDVQHMRLNFANWLFSKTLRKTCNFVQLRGLFDNFVTLLAFAFWITLTWPNLTLPHLKYFGDKIFWSHYPNDINNRWGLYSNY
jgi:hypothetical protein